MSNINYENEQFFLNLVKCDILLVSYEGKVFNNKTGNFIGNNSSSKYYSIGYKVNGKTIHQLVHRLVFLVHGGILTEEFPIVNHIDGNKRNNHFDNLEASNNSKNVKHAYDTGLALWNEEKRKRNLFRQSGEKSSNANFSNVDADYIRELYKTGKYTHRSLGTLYNVDHTLIGDIIRNKSYINHRLISN